jgi:glutathione S-transferase
MDDHLKNREWFVGSAISLADICLFAYTHVAGDAEFDLSRYPNIVAWMERVKGTPHYTAMMPE